MINIIKQINSKAFIITILLMSGCAAGHASYPALDNRIESMETTVRYLTTVKPSRSYDNLESMKRSANYISQKFDEYGLKPEEQKFSVSGNTYVNVLAVLAPRRAVV